MATDLKKFLDQAGVSTLWSRVAEEVAKVDSKASANAATLETQASEISTMKGQIEALEAGTYDDKEVRGLISTNATNIQTNADAIALLNNTADVAGSVAHTATAIAAAKVAEIVANADADFDTLKEIADWILNDTTGAADMANDIKALQNQMAGIDSTVVAKIAAEIEAALKVDGADKYALASDLSALAVRVKTIEDAGYRTANQVGSAIDAKIAALNLATTYEAKGAATAAETRAKAYADGLATNYDAAGSAAQALADAKAYTDTEAAKHETKGAAAQALADAKTYTDTEVAKVQALTEAEIDAAIEAAKNT